MSSLEVELKLLELLGALGEPRTKAPQDQVLSDRQALCLAGTGEVIRSKKRKENFLAVEPLFPITHPQLCQVRPLAERCIVPFFLIFAPFLLPAHVHLPD